VLANSDAGLELIVVDQSDSDDGRRRVEAAVDDGRLRWIATPTRGLSRSRNIAIAAARAPILAFTDDDCRVPEDWVPTIRRVTSRYADAALVFGRVVSRMADVSGSFAADFNPSEDRELQNTVLDIGENPGIGANMIVRRGTFDRIGTFDPILGAGAPLQACEDLDLAIRVLAGGLKILHSTEITVAHLGVRQGGDASALMRGYGLGMGATLAKHMRLRTDGSAQMLARWLSLNVPRVLGNFVRGERATGIGYVSAGLLGIGRSFLHPVDVRGSVYADS
jgi:glycosyltransferase involved in cell wall biosynthesis